MADIFKIVLLVVVFKISPAIRAIENSPINSHIEQIGLLTLSTSSGTASISSHGNSLLVSDNVLEESHSTLQLESVDGLGGLTGVLEAGAKIRATGAGALRAGGGLDSVTDLYVEIKSTPVSSSSMFSVCLFSPDLHHRKQGFTGQRQQGQAVLRRQTYHLDEGLWEGERWLVMVSLVLRRRLRRRRFFFLLLRLFVA